MSAATLALTRRAQALGKWGEALAGDDFVALPGSELAGWFPPAGLARLVATWNHLIRDETVVGGVVRERRYGRLLASRLPTGEWSFTALAHQAFQQTAEHIPLYDGKARMFSPIAQETLADPVLTALIATDLAIVCAVVPQATRFEVGLHQMRVLATPDAPGSPTPEGRHRDGHDFIGMHLMGRANCAGGESIIHRDGLPQTRMTLTERLDSVVVSDTRITHEVTPTVADGAIGVRDMLLVDINER
ncbi:2OG-Fe dioxygenase family protein [Streptomyces sp. SID14478]|uniref:2OG-Fe dioxygenase family protein n=1 Tax=Streptomyces sp. SID14478 TaxID=2706073 RepID=UPI0013DACAF5|nr:2OG-Fe dioxygenase family protein [Streptomyces sp. SID14478]NEB76148.1 2OG-Fe dioxygenase family protein [Streptomyces sp. SID14478]